MDKSTQIRFNDIMVSLLELRVWFQDEEVHFTKTELKILLIFLAEPYETISTTELVRRADLMSIQELQTMISRIRALLDHQYIVSHGWGGYSFVKSTKWSRLVP